MIEPAPLRKGDKIAIVATARKVSSEEMQPAIDLFKHWGLEVVIPEGLFEQENQFAGSDDHRANALQQQINDPSIKAIICARGGYGSVRMVDKVDWTMLVQHPKWIIGYSDATVLHSHIHNNCNLATIHGIMPINIPIDATEKDYPAIKSLKDALWGEKYQYSGQGTHYRTGNCDGEIVGGNLSILYSLCGSESDINTEDKILMIEDLDEYLYHIDRMMQNLKRTGKLSRLKGLIVGKMSDMHDNTIPFGQSAEEIIWECVKEYDYPVVMNANIGHIGTENLAIELGGLHSLNIFKKGEYYIKKR